MNDDRLIVALDVPNVVQGLALADRIGDADPGGQHGGQFLQGQNHIGMPQAASLHAPARFARANFDHRQPAPLQLSRRVALAIGTQHAFQADTLGIQYLIVKSRHGLALTCRQHAALPPP